MSYMYESQHDEEIAIIKVLKAFSRDYALVGHLDRLIFGVFGTMPKLKLILCVKTTTKFPPT